MHGGNVREQEGSTLSWFSGDEHGLRNRDMKNSYCRIDIERCAEYTDASSGSPEDGTIAVCVIGDRSPEEFAGGDDKIVRVIFSVYGRTGNRDGDYPGMAEHLADFADIAKGLDVAKALAKGFGVELAVGFDPLRYGVEEFQSEDGRLRWPEVPIRVVVSAINANGAADFCLVKVACTHEQFEKGEHYETAKAQAEAEGYASPMLAYDEEDSAARAIMEHFAWEMASVVPCRRKDRLFIGVYPAGLVYADRGEEVDGDYKRLASLDYATLTLKFQDGCGADMAARIQKSAAELQGRQGEEFEISATGGTVILGSELAQTAAGGIKP
jgi:hypothetical protein